MPNGWKKNAAYVGENANSHQEYLDEKNKFRKWKKNNEVNYFWDIYPWYHWGNEHWDSLEPRLSERSIQPLFYRKKDNMKWNSFYGKKDNMKWNSKNTENTCYTKFINGKSRVYSNERNSRYSRNVRSDPFNKRYKKRNHQDKPHTLKKNYNQVNVSVKKNTKTPIKFVDISHECVVCLENNWEHRMKKLVCKKRQKNSNYVCKKCAEQISNYGERKCPLCRSHWI